MATTTQNPNDLTRQQLDELDDLLQRMLSLPLNPPESFSPPSQSYAPPVPTAAPASAPAASLLGREAFAPQPVAAHAQRVYTPPAAEPAESPFDFKPAPPPVSPPAAVSPPILGPTSTAATPLEWPDSGSAKMLPSIPPVARPEPVPFLFAPLVAFNALLNWTLGLFGFPGRILRSGFVKTLFGLAGFSLIAYTTLKVAQIHGLVTLPQELPWPPR